MYTIEKFDFVCCYRVIFIVFLYCCREYVFSVFSLNRSNFPSNSSASSLIMNWVMIRTIMEDHRNFFWCFISEIIYIIYIIYYIFIILLYIYYIIYLLYYIYSCVMAVILNFTMFFFSLNSSLQIWQCFCFLYFFFQFFVKGIIYFSLQLIILAACLLRSAKNIFMQSTQL